MVGVEHLKHLGDAERIFECDRNAAISRTPESAVVKTRSRS
jgi:hypothetical protein